MSVTFSVLLACALVPQPPRSDQPLQHLESVRRRASVVYLASVLEVRRVAPIEELTKPTQGQMEAKVRVEKVLRAPAGVAPPREALLRYDTRAPDPEGDGFHTLAPGEGILAFADSFDLVYPLELFHGSTEELSRQVGALRDELTHMDAQSLRLHGLDAAARTRQHRLYEAALRALTSRRR